MTRDLGEFTKDDFEKLGKEIEGEFRDKIAEDWGQKFLENYEEYKKKYPKVINLEYDAKTIADILFWFTTLRLIYKYNLEEAKEILGDALTISKENLSEGLVKATSNHEDFVFDANPHIFIDNVFEKVRKRRLKVYRRKRPKPRRKIPREKIQELREQGLSLGEISKKLGVPKTTIFDTLKKK